MGGQKAVEAAQNHVSVRINDQREIGTYASDHPLQIAATNRVQGAKELQRTNWDKTRAYRLASSRDKDILG